MRAWIRRFDAWLSHRNGVFEFSRDQYSLLRLQLTVARRPLFLSDCQVERGAPVLQLHLWNEHLLTPAPAGPDLAWAKLMQRLFLKSLKEAAHYVGEHPKLAEARAVGGITVLLGAGGFDGGARLVERLGFTVLPYYTPWGYFGEFWENFYSWVLIWTYNPASLRYRSLVGMRRKEFWISTGEFQRRFGVGE